MSESANGLRIAHLETPLGRMIAGATDTHLLLLEFADERDDARVHAQLARLARQLSQPCVPGESPVHAVLRVQLAEYFAGTRQRFDVPFDSPGTEFQRRVWRALLDIPPGATCSYLAIATAIGQPAAVRAVAQANGNNRIAILIPCHRVIGADGSLTGYGGGLWRKRKLLDLEGGVRALL